MISSKIQFSVLLGIISMPVLSYGSEGPLTFDFEVTGGREDNITRSFVNSDVRQDTFSELFATMNYELEPNQSSVIFCHLSAGSQTFNEYTGLSNTSLSASVDYSFQTAFAFYSPRYTLGLAIKEQTYESDLRSSSIFDLNARILFRLTTKLSLVTGLVATQREADTNVFDQQSQRVFVHMDYSAVNRVWLYGSLNYTQGDTSSTLTTTNPDTLAQTIGYATVSEAFLAGAILPDDAFGGSASNEFAYRIEADTTVMTGGVNLSFNQHHAVDLSAQIIHTDTVVPGLSYDNYILRLGYLAHF